MTNVISPKRRKQESFENHHVFYYRYTLSSNRVHLKDNGNLLYKSIIYLNAFSLLLLIVLILNLGTIRFLPFLLSYLCTSACVL